MKKWYSFLGNFWATPDNTAIFITLNNGMKDGSQCFLIIIIFIIALLLINFGTISFTWSVCFRFSSIITPDFKTFQLKYYFLQSFHKLKFSGLQPEIFRAGEVLWNQSTLVFLFKKNNRRNKRPSREKCGSFFSQILLKLHLE